jgi:hypothetical protein
MTQELVLADFLQTLQDSCGTDGAVPQSAGRDVTAKDLAGLDDDQLKAVFGRFLERAGLSPGLVHHRGEESYWLVREIKGPPSDFVGAPRDSGAWFERRGQRWFVSRVIPESLAAHAGLKRGDEVLLEKGSTPPWRTASVASIAVRSTPWALPLSLKLAEAPRPYAESLRRYAHARTFKTTSKGQSLGYLPITHAYSVRDREWIERSLKDMQAQTEGLVIDLRDGFGGDLPGIVPLFAALPGSPDKAVYTKPIVVLVNQGTSGNLAWVARLLRQKGQVVLLGQTSGPDYVRLDARPFGGDQWLFLAPSFDAASGHCQGQAPLSPDLRLDDPLVYAGGADPLVEEAFVQLGSGVTGTKEKL